jgi:hypothetical protein
MSLLDKVRALVGSAGAELPEDPEIRSLVHAYLKERGADRYRVNVKETPSGAALLALPPERLARALQSVLLEDVADGRDQMRSDAWDIRWRRDKLVSEICRRAFPVTAEEARAILELHARIQARERWLKYRSLPKAIGRAAQAAGHLHAIRASLENVREVLLDSGYAGYADVRKALKDIELLLDEAAGVPPQAARLERDAWGDKAIAALEALDLEARNRWQTVLNYCATAKGSSPSAKWLKTGAELVEFYGKREFAERACAWLALLAEPAPKRDDADARRFIVGEANGDLLKGLAWLLVHVPEESVGVALADGAAAAFRKIPNFGARSAKAGNACLHTLKNFPGMLGARQLAVLAPRVKQPSHAAAVEKALAECAARLNMSVAETEELATPDHGFSEGRRTLEFGEARAELAIEGTSVTVSWFGADGKQRKSEPAQVKSEFAEARKSMKRLVAEVEKSLTAIRDRLERLPLESREWPFELWRSRYLDHPVASALARRLIWRFRKGDAEQAALWIGGKWLDESGGTVDPQGSTVLPWHPVFASAESVRRWRAMLTTHGVVQPFKQAHREIYLLTDAERATRTYSNRFAAHVLRQHQFAQLCAARGWKYRLMGGFDSHNYPTLELPQWNLFAEFWVEGPGNNDGMTPSGIYLHVLTDQVRFYPIRTGEAPLRARIEPVALEEVPPIVLSEVMRDVDLFVGVASVGNDPNWSDGGPDGRYRTYWQEYSWGELSVAAQNRKEILAELLPRLTALKSLARIDGRFLVVQGKLRSYKIHIGSGNILMEPNDQYLCIVPDRSPRESAVQLPFEGDSLLAVILSKAFLLIADDRITDTTITRQISWQ